MEYKTKYTKEEAIEKATEFLAEIREIEEKYSMSFNSDRGDIYLSFKTSDKGSNQWSSVRIGWFGDGTGLKVIEKTDNAKRLEALSKLSDEDKKILGL